MPPAKKDPSISLAAGCLAGAVECCCTWPMEYVKTQLQTFRKVSGGKPPPFTGIGSGLVYTVRTTGFLSLYNGLAPVRACDESADTYLALKTAAGRRYLSFPCPRLGYDLAPTPILRICYVIKTPARCVETDEPAFI